MKKHLTSSFTILLICIGFISIFRLNNVSERETSWDVLGYYIHLPATFIYEDALMENREWIEKINEEKQLTGTLYQISTNDKGDPIYFFLMGMAIFLLPFFLLGHFSAWVFDYPMDGFSLPYQYSLVLGGIIYTIVGLIFLRKILRHYFPDKLVGLLLFLIVFGTNYIHHLTLKNLETVNILFLLMTVIIWNTIKWHQNFKTKNLVIIGASITLMALVKPSEIMVVFIPLLWGIYSKETLFQKWRMIVIHKKSFFIAILVCILIGLPQMLYWIVRTGHLFYDSYKNPGVGLDIFSPHLFNSMFSFQKGWFIYTPIMIFGILGFYQLFKKNREISVGLIVYFLIAFYIIISWSEWWYGAGFSNRPLIMTYPILAITMGYFFVYLKQKSKIFKIGITGLILFFVFLNQFQWWQLRNGILEPYRTTKEYYLATFLKTKATPEDKNKLLVYRDFSEEYEFKDQENYNRKGLYEINNDSLGDSFFSFSPSVLYSSTFEFPYIELTNSDHLWVKASLRIKFPGNRKGELPSLVFSMERKEGAYGYYALPILDSIKGEWIDYELEYMTPNIRDRNDRLKCYVWNQGKISFEIKDFEVEIFERKNYNY